MGVVMDAGTLIREARAYPPGSLDHQYRLTAAWKLDQMSRGVPVDDWTDTPPAGFGLERRITA